MLSLSFHLYFGLILFFFLLVCNCRMFLVVSRVSPSQECNIKFSILRQDSCQNTNNLFRFQKVFKFVFQPFKFIRSFNYNCKLLYKCWLTENTFFKLVFFVPYSTKYSNKDISIKISHSFNGCIWCRYKFFQDFVIIRYKIIKLIGLKKPILKFIMSE